MGKFKKGDVVIGNDQADRFYALTGEGCKLRILDCQDNYFSAVTLDGSAEYKSLATSCFDLLEPTSSDSTAEDRLNPKAAIGSVSLPVHLWPASATAFGCIGIYNGRGKYGQDNFVATEVAASVYTAACLRHIFDWLNGDDADPKDGVHNLSGALANLAIIVDALCAGTLHDDRRLNTGAWRIAREMMEPHVKRLQELHADKSPKHYTIKDSKREGKTS